ncbi:hypothetical protein FJZ26_03400 [Candidatus Parvarchaeota archaeon]|nr:hypothetical protein [Candidatus Parvarchaeota archaeon]
MKTLMMTTTEKTGTRKANTTRLSLKGAMGKVNLFLEWLDGKRAGKNGSDNHGTSRANQVFPSFQMPEEFIHANPSSFEEMKENNRHTKNQNSHGNGCMANRVLEEYAPLLELTSEGMTYLHEQRLLEREG